MIEVTGDLWAYPADVRVITTNGFVKNNGECVMGRGCALEAKTRWPDFPLYLGKQIRMCGNVVLACGIWPGEAARIYTFPVKHVWNEKADINLIVSSARDLVQQIDQLNRVGQNLNTIVMPRPGCGNGGLQWCRCINGEGESCSGVKHVIAPILDNRFHVITHRR